MNRWLDRFQTHYVGSLGIAGGLVYFLDVSIKIKRHIAKKSNILKSRNFFKWIVLVF